MMQRSSNTMVRNVLIGSVSIILLISVLYYMKRVEVGRLKKDMDGLVVSFEHVEECMEVLLESGCIMDDRAGQT